MCHRLIFPVVLALFGLPGAGSAASRPAPLAQRGVDLVVLRDAPPLLGAIVGISRDGSLQVVVERAWLREANPAFYKGVSQSEIADARRALTELRDRIAAWKQRRPESLNLLALLTLEERRVETALDELADGSGALDTQFVLLAVPPKDVRRVHRQAPERKQIALAAWRERLSDVATRSAGDLARELRERNVEITAETVDLSDRLPPRPQDEREWAARVALVEHQFVSRLELQGSGSAFFPADGENLPPLAQLLGELYRSEVGRLLDEAAGGALAKQSDEWVERATGQAEQRHVAGVRVTRMTPDLTGRRVSIESRFLARLPDGTWETIWRHAETGDAGRRRPEVEARIAKDPQVRQALEAIGALGLAGDDAVQLALHFGAATFEAQQTADARFQEFHGRYLRRLDGPPLVWPGR